MRAVAVSRETADEVCLFSAMKALSHWREAGRPPQLDMSLALLALHQAARSANPAISARAAAELARIA